MKEKENQKKNEKRVVIPGEILGTEEEFIPGEGTITDKEGNIRAVVVGDINIDENRQINIKSDQVLSPMRVGDVVYGMVEEMFESVAFITMEHKQSPTSKRLTHTSAIIPVSEIQEGYLECIRDAIHVGDYVKAVVTEITPFRLVLSLKPKGMGVVQAFCSYDRQPMNLKGNYAVCTNCGQKEIRRFGVPYGEYKFVPRLDFSELKKEKFERGSRESRREFKSERPRSSEGRGFRREDRRGFSKRPFSGKDSLHSKRGRFGGQSKF